MGGVHGDGEGKEGRACVYVHAWCGNTAGPFQIWACPMVAGLWDIIGWFGTVK